MGVDEEVFFGVDDFGLGEALFEPGGGDDEGRVGDCGDEFGGADEFGAGEDGGRVGCGFVDEGDAEGEEGAFGGCFRVFVGPGVAGYEEVVSDFGFWLLFARGGGFGVGGVG